MMEAEYAEYRCTACKKEVKNVVIHCKTCVKCFYHPGCVSKHRILKDKELVKCDGPFEEIDIAAENGKTEMRRTGDDRGRLGSTGRMDLAATTSTSSKQISVDTKIDWLVRTVKEMKDEVACKNEIKTMIKQIIREELVSFKKEFEELKQNMHGGNAVIAGSGQSYSEAVKEKKESILIVKPKKEQESETTRKIVKEKVNIKDLAVGITKLRKGGKGSVILGCESEREIKQLKDTVSEKLGKDFEIMEPKKIKPKLKVLNVDEDEMKLKDENLIDTIKKQNNIDGSERGFYIRVVKRIDNERRGGTTRTRRGNKEEGSLILEVDEETHELILKRGKINIGWRKCMVFNHYSVRRCFKCWGYYHIAKNCTRQETCHKCAGNHKASECTSTKKKCINCMYKNKTYNLKINDEHDALSVECPTYIRALEEEKKRTGWDSGK